MRERGGMLESKFQSEVLQDLTEMFGEFHKGGCMILLNDAEYMQGIPDILILYKDKWAMLEVKRRRPTRPEDYRPNQEWYIDMLDKMSYASVIYPGNKEMVYDDLQRTFRP